MAASFPEPRSAFGTLASQAYTSIVRGTHAYTLEKHNDIVLLRPLPALQLASAVTNMFSTAPYVHICMPPHTSVHHTHSLSRITPSTYVQVPSQHLFLHIPSTEGYCFKPASACCEPPEYSVIKCHADPTLCLMWWLASFLLYLLLLWGWPLPRNTPYYIQRRRRRRRKTPPFPFSPEGFVQVLVVLCQLYAMLMPYNCGDGACSGRCQLGTSQAPE